VKEKRKRVRKGLNVRQKGGKPHSSILVYQAVAKEKKGRREGTHQVEARSRKSGIRCGRKNTGKNAFGMACTYQRSPEKKKEQCRGTNEMWLASRDKNQRGG